MTELGMPSARRRRAVITRLLDWYAAHRRALPWREQRDPYAIWVSEVMLQQTQVATVIPYYERWMRRFPTLVALARANEQSVLAAWQGLGYYSRARRLHAGARAVMELHDGRMPRSADGLRQLPGIGAYSAGAIASMAYAEPEPVVDGNVIRVLCRLEALDGDPMRAPLSRHLWALARRLLPPEHPGDFNQALMELGATVCSSRQPRCPACPLVRLCQARRQDRVAELPRAQRRLSLTHLRKVSVVLVHRRLVLVTRQPDSALQWAGLWVFPFTEARPGERAEQTAAALAASASGAPVDLSRMGPPLRYAVTRFRISLDVFTGRLPARYQRPHRANQDLSWQTPRSLVDLPMPAVHRRIARLLKTR